MACCAKKIIRLGVVASVWGWLFDFLVHGIALKGLYTVNAAHFRPEEQMMEMMPFCILYHLAMGFLFAAGYACWRSKISCSQEESACTPCKKSLGFGLWLGLLLGIPQLMVFVWTTLPLELPVVWFASEVVKWAFTGVLLNKFYGK